MQRWLIPLGVFLVLFYWALNEAWPMVGHDYFYFLPRLIAGRWHFAQQGLRPFWFTPHFCGGIPQYPNPQDMYYSLQQLFALVLPMWWSVQGAMLLYLLFGYWGWVRFGCGVLKLKREWAHVLALVVMSNGYYVLHMVVGHIASLTLPLMGVLLWLLFERRQSHMHSAALFALVASAVLYSGGYLVLLYTGMVALALVPFVAKRPLAPLIIRVLSCSGALLCVGASKLVAVASLMRNFPRELAFKELPHGESVVLFVVRSLFEIPQRVMVFSLDEVGVHDYSVFVSPVVLVGIVWWMVNQMWRVLGEGVVRQASRVHHRMWLMVCAVFVITLFFLQLTAGHGVLVDWLKPLPAFSSLHVVTRFLYVPAVLLSIAGVWCLAQLMRYCHASLICAALTLVAFVVAYVPLLTMESDPLRRTLDISQVEEDPLASRVSEVVSWRGVSGFKSVREGVSNVECTEPLFGQLSAGIHTEGAFGQGAWLRTISSLVPGPSDAVHGGAFNLHHPVCFFAPKEHHCQPFDRIALEDSRNLHRFLEGRRTSWRLPLLQHIANWVSIAGLIGALAVVVVGGRARIR